MDNGIKKSYNGVNIMRFICAILVVTIHTWALFSLGDVPGAVLSFGIARIAVPFFFITSGYFFYRNFNKKGYTRKYLKKLATMYLICIAGYTIFAFGHAIQRNSDLNFLTMNVLINGYEQTLWYFPTLILSTAFVSIFLKNNWIKLLIILSILVYPIGLMGDSYYGLIVGTPLEHIIRMYNTIFVSTRNGICFSVPFITIGVLINKYSLNEKVKRYKIYVPILLAILILEGYILIISNIARDYNMYATLIILSPLIFIWALNSNFNISERTSRLLKDLSLWIYCIHELIIILILQYIPSLSKNTIVLFIIVATVSLAISYIAIRKKGFLLGRFSKKELKDDYTK